MKTPWPDLARCGDCGRLLDQPDAPLSESVQFDCAACAVLYETGAPPPDLPADRLRAWLAPHLARVRQLRGMIDRALAAAGPSVEDDMQERLIVICSQRLILDGLSEQQARARATAILSEPLPWPLPSLDDLC